MASLSPGLFLICHNSEDQSTLLEAAIAKAFPGSKCTHTHTLESCIALSWNENFDCVFLGSGEGIGDRKKAIADFKTDNRFVPLIMLEEKYEEQDISGHLHAGADDCLIIEEIEHVNLSRLIRHAIARAGRNFTAFCELDSKINTVNIKEREKVLRSLTHEIKNPLSTIYLTIDSLRHADEDGEDVDFYFQMLEKSAKNIDAFLNRLIETVTTEDFVMTKKNLAMVMRDSLASTMERKLPKVIAIKDNYSQQQLDMNLDDEKLQTALQHIFTNAFEAFEEDLGREPNIDITLTEKHGQAIIKVKDNGCGMSATTLENLFVPFYSTAPAKRKGLGLNFAKRIIVGHNGKIDIRSEAGVGTEITITIPIS
jgi:signal transduction histidine kinase